VHDDVGPGELADPLAAAAARRPGFVAVGDHHEFGDAASAGGHHRRDRAGLGGAGDVRAGDDELLADDQGELELHLAGLPLTQGDAADKAKAAGADFVGMEELAEQVKGGMMDFDVVIASPDAMRVVGQLGQILGPRGLMPNPKTGTVTPDVAAVVREYKAGKVEFRNDSGGNVHAVVGKLSFEPDKLKDNIQAFIDHILGLKPAAVKGTYLRGISIAATMSPGVKVAA